MSGPATICLKRKAGEDPPEHLVVQKRQISEEVGEEIRYTLKRKEEEPLFQNLAPSKPSSTATSRPSSREGRRTFHLARTLGASSGVQKRRDGKRKREDVLTVEERRGASTAASTGRRHAEVAHGSEADDTKPLKRPGKGSAVRRPAPAEEPFLLGSDDDEEVQARGLRDQRRVEALADDLHAFALAEIARAPKPKVTAVPKLSAARSREIHQQRTAAAAVSPRKARASGDVRMAAGDEDGEYVYDTYVLAPSIAAAAATVRLDTPTNLTDAEAEGGNIGYLILNSSSDEALWETFMDEDDSDAEFEDDEEDENAEGYYGADYPEDEMASDDEFGRGAYRYRRGGGSDGEEWDDEEEDGEDCGVYSEGGEEEDEVEREMKAWKGRVAGRGSAAVR